MKLSITCSFIQSVAVNVAAFNGNLTKYSTVTCCKFSSLIVRVCNKCIHFRCILLATLFDTSAATLGFDTIQNLTVKDFLCLKDHGYTFYIARIWQSLGKFDKHGMQNMRNAHKAGFKVNAYIFPCLAKKCAPPQEQVETTINRLKSEGVEYDMVFLDIQIFDWPSDMEANRKFINAMGNKLDEMCVNWGIYTNENNWSNIVGKNFDKWKHKKLWWAYWGANDGTRKKNFKPFGGWKRFYMQQYAGDFKGPCGVNLDLDYMK